MDIGVNIVPLKNYNIALVHVNLGSNLKLLHEGACDEMKSVAEHSTLELTEKLQSKVHYTLSYIESEDKQVILGEKGEGLKLFAFDIN